MSPKVDELPKSLQKMIADCQNAIANWDSEDDTDDPVLRSMLESTREWTLRLSRGEFEQDLYWKCVADDCEKAGDWQGALSAYRQILDMPDELGFTRAKTLSAMASIHSVLGDDKAASKSYQMATAASVKEVRVLNRMVLTSEVSQLIRMGNIRRARKLISSGLAHDPNESVDHLGTARLLVEWAKCDLASDNLISAAQYLQNAWEWLNALVESFAGDEDSLRQASGIQIAYATWWSTEAKRRRMAREGDSEVVALERAIEKVRLCFTPCGYQRSWYDLRLMNLLLQLADACERHGMPTDAALARNEADDIFTKRRFPESARWPRYNDGPPVGFALLRNWRTIIRWRMNRGCDGTSRQRENRRPME
jgi:tetratricopeptide (TPR) repeat protein